MNILVVSNFLVKTNATMCTYLVSLFPEVELVCLEIYVPPTLLNFAKLLSQVIELIYSMWQYLLSSKIFSPSAINNRSSKF